MAFEVLAPFIDIVEKGLTEKKTPRVIADELGQSGLYQTIRRYKIAVFDLNKEANAAWREERAKNHDQRLEEGKAEIINTLEVINLGKLRARQLLGLNLGDEYVTAEGENRKLSWGSAAIYWQAGQKMICGLSRAEAEIAGDDPESRKARALEDLSDVELNNLLRAIGAEEKSNTQKGS